MLARSDQLLSSIVHVLSVKGERREGRFAALEKSLVGQQTPGVTRRCICLRVQRMSGILVKMVAQGGRGMRYAFGASEREGGE